ncbi:hypothetical protein [Jannaschia marina]|uniref:hypothetical protein n=1 Tax=Jannaschia marina TaxID=2741674 RepID=UPI0015C9D61D|nr:hypothetical protein [Jannaschia marina]
MSDFATLRIGPELAPRSDRERDDFLRAAGLLDRGGCPWGFAGHSAVWARDRELLIGQGALVELDPAATELRARLVPRGLARDLRVAAIEMLGVRAEYRETGLEERIVRALVEMFARTPPLPTEAVIYMGEMRAPVLLSTLLALGPVGEVLR